MKKHLLIALLATAGFTTVANAATISFFQDGLQYPMKAKGPAIQGIDPYAFTSIPNGQKFSINNVAQGVINTTLSLEADSAPAIPYAPVGSLSWTNYSGTTYEFDISAGGYPGQWDPKIPYCIDVVVDGRDIGHNCSSATSYWAPTIANATLTNNSSIQVFISKQ